MLYHVLRSPIQPGNVLQSQFGLEPPAPGVYEVVRSALAEGPAAVKSLLLADALQSLEQPQTGLGLEMYLKETMFELVRVSQFSTRPSRFECIFLFITLRDALAESQTLHNRLGVARCKVEGGTQTGLDMRLSGPVADHLEPINKQLGELLDRAKRYWKGDVTDDPTIEILATGTVTVVDIVTT